MMQTTACVCLATHLQNTNTQSITVHTQKQPAVRDRITCQSKYLYLMMGLAPAAGVTFVQLGVLDREIYTTYVRRRLFI